MPCEGCNGQFNLFRRKRSCGDCKRFYCSNCLSGSKRSSHIALCERCKIFAKRPLLRSDLLHLKPKDLIFYLQSKHISTTGCVEKDELVKLVLNHVQQSEAGNAGGSSSPRSETDGTNSFDSLKQTCQNFFSNITENISESLASFDGKGRPKFQQNSENRSNNAEHVFDQPRVSTREIPTYASYQNTYDANYQQHRNVEIPVEVAANQSSLNIPDSAGTSSSTVTSGPSEQSDVLELPSIRTSTMQKSSPQSNQKKSISAYGNFGKVEITSDCECSDDELIESAQLAGKGVIECGKERVIVDSSTVSPLPSTSNVHAGDEYNSSESSFEELGAIGGISDDSKAATDTNSSNIDQWQILDQQTQIPSNKAASDQQMESKDLQQTVTPQIKRVPRRRSDSYLNKRLQISDIDLIEGSDEATILRIRSINCNRCGKNKSNIKRHVERMRRHLESSEMGEEDIKREIAEFLEYLEKRTKSVDYSDSEPALSPVSEGNAAQQDTHVATTGGFMSDDDGIHVYGGNTEDTIRDSRFIHLEDFDDLKELECLSVKQLKEVLMLNRVDYKGCCEKQELLERVERLWINLKSAPSIDKLQTDELCKICMDAPIECVILECGHMATCTNCGKVLSECPICRQYIVRVVRFFRA